MRLNNRLITSLGMASLITAATVLAAPTASAVGCTGLGCNGKNPETQGCGADAVSYNRRTEGERWIEMRWSRACDAVWARGRSGSFLGENISLDRQTVSSGTITTVQTKSITSTLSTGYTPMRGTTASYRFRACGDSSGSAGGDVICTSFRLWD